MVKSYQKTLSTRKKWKIPFLSLVSPVTPFRVLSLHCYSSTKWTNVSFPDSHIPNKIRCCIVNLRIKDNFPIALIQLLKQKRKYQKKKKRQLNMVFALVEVIVFFKKSNKQCKVSNLEVKIFLFRGMSFLKSILLKEELWIWNIPSYLGLCGRCYDRDMYV